MQYILFYYIGVSVLICYFIFVFFRLFDCLAYDTIDVLEFCVFCECLWQCLYWYLKSWYFCFRTHPYIVTLSHYCSNIKYETIQFYIDLDNLSFHAFITNTFFFCISHSRFIIVILRHELIKNKQNTNIKQQLIIKDITFENLQQVHKSPKAKHCKQ